MKEEPRCKFLFVEGTRLSPALWCLGFAKASEGDPGCAGSLLSGYKRGSMDPRGLASGACVTGTHPILETVFLPPSEDKYNGNCFC